MAKAKVTTTSAEASADSLEEITKQFFETLRKVHASAGQKVESSYRNLNAVPQDIHGKVRAQAVEALNTYLDALRSSVGQADAGSRMESGYRNYAAILQRTAEGAQRDLAKAVQEYADNLKEVPDSVRKGVMAAWHQYTTDLHNYIEEIEWESLDPKTAAALAHSLLAVSASTAAAVG